MIDSNLNRKQQADPTGPARSNAQKEVADGHAQSAGAAFHAPTTEPVFSAPKTGVNARGKRAPSRATIARRCVLGGLFALFVAGLAFNIGWGGACSFGIDAIAQLCPLGALETMLGSWAFVPRLAIGLGIAVAVALLTGRAFCSWVCPVPPVARVLQGRRGKKRETAERAEAGKVALARWNQRREKPGSPRLSRQALDSRHLVLAGALGSAAVFGFPVFCLVCPVGLTLATVVSLVRLVAFNEPTWGLVAFPAIVVVELVALRRWCSTLCPVGALLGLIGKLNRTLRPSADAAKCLRTREGDESSATCAVCATACPEHIDPRADLGLAAASECTRCHRCADACPAQAITFPLLKK